MNYSQECEMGRNQAAQVMQEAVQTGNIPRMVQAIREAAKDETSAFSTGFLFAIGAEAVK